MEETDRLLCKLFDEATRLVRGWGGGELIAAWRVTVCASCIRIKKRAVSVLKEASNVAWFSLAGI